MFNPDAESSNILGGAYKEARGWTDALTSHTVDFFSKLVVTMEKEAMLFAERAIASAKEGTAIPDNFSLISLLSDGSTVSPLFLAALDALAVAPDDIALVVEVVVASVAQRLLYSSSLSRSLLSSVLANLRNGQPFKILTELVAEGDLPLSSLATARTVVTFPLSGVATRAKVPKVLQSLSIPQALQHLLHQPPAVTMSLLADCPPALFFSISAEACLSVDAVPKTLFSDFMIPLMWVRRDLRHQPDTDSVRKK